MIMAISKSKKHEIAGRVNSIVKELINAPELEDLTDTQIEAIAKSVLADQLKDKLKKEVNKARCELAPLRDRWLAGFDSIHTRRNFRVNFDMFIEWLGGIHFLDVNSQVVDDYLIFLKTQKIGSKKISDNTARQRIAAPSSFYRALLRWQKISVNPFLGCKQPKKKLQIKSVEKIPENSDLDELEKIAAENINTNGSHVSSQRKRQSGKMALAALIVLRATGLRIGALPMLTIEKNGKYYAESKGGIASGKLSEEALNRLAELGLDQRKPFDEYKSFSIWIYRATDGKFSPHSIRHRFAIDHYRENKDIARLQKALGHSSLTATTSYLSGLGF
jgi:site-specific recombinase XerD